MRLPGNGNAKALVHSLCALGSTRSLFDCVVGAVVIKLAGTRAWGTLAISFLLSWLKAVHAGFISAPQSTATFIKMFISSVRNFIPLLAGMALNDVSIPKTAAFVRRLVLVRAVSGVRKDEGLIYYSWNGIQAALKDMPIVMS